MRLTHFDSHRNGGRLEWFLIGKKIVENQTCKCQTYANDKGRVRALKVPESSVQGSHGITRHERAIFFFFFDAGENLASLVRRPDFPLGGLLGLGGAGFRPAKN